MKVRKSLLLVAMSLGFGVVQLDVSVVNVALKSIGTSLGGDISALQWVVNAYTIVFASLILTAGSLGDRFGAKRLYIAGFSLFTVASLMCGIAPNIYALIAARAVQGIGAAILMPCSLTLLNHSHKDPQERKRAIGFWAAGASTALAGGPLVGGFLIGAMNWRAIFFINLPLGLIGIALTLLYADETPKNTRSRLDLPGQISTIVCLASLAVAIIEGGKHGFLNPSVILGYIAAAVALYLFIMRERATKFPMLPLKLFRSRTYSLMSAIGLLINVAFYGLIFTFSLFFQTSQHLSALQTGLAFAPMTAIILFSNIYASKLAATIGDSRTIIAGAFLVILGCLGLIGISPNSAYVSIVLQMLAIGIGLGFIVPVMTAEQLSSIDKSMSGIASGTLTTARQTGSVIGVSLYGSLIASHTLPNALKEALILSTALLAFVILAASIILPRRSRQ